LANLFFVEDKINVKTAGGAQCSAGFVEIVPDSMPTAMHLSGNGDLYLLPCRLGWDRESCGAGNWFGEIWLFKGHGHKLVSEFRENVVYVYDRRLLYLWKA
jgi:hypothetical protein